ncbi:MAG TPA: alkaline phosphatase family protein [Gaiellaceae bacterium]|nr:alkaline phosphatase family protein [Gaiellaceae bacterium]
MKHRSTRTLGLLLALALAVAVPAALGKPKPKPKHQAKAAKKTGHPSRGRDVQHVFVIMLENHSQQGVIGDPNAPAITALAHRYASASNYYGVTHPSLPNYVAFLSGSNWWSNSDDAGQRFDHVNLVDQLERAHRTWAGYMEAMPADDKLVEAWPSTANALYASKHNPFVLFEDIRNDPARLAHVKPYAQLATDLKRQATTPDFAFIVPDQCNDMHGGVYTAVPGHPETPCPYGSTSDDANDAALKQKADAWVKQAVDTITASPAWKGGKSVIVVTADEGDYTGNAETGGWDSPAGCCDSPVLPAGAPAVSATWPGGVYGGGLVPTVVITNHGGPPSGYVSTVPYNHYSLLATIEQLWGLGKLVYASDTAQVTPMLDLFPK